jgi:hypothetical protein
LPKYDAQSRVAELAKDPEIADLSREVAILRFLQERILSSCESDSDVSVIAPKLGNLIAHTIKAVSALLEGRRGTPQDPDAVTRLMEYYIYIIIQHTTDNQLGRIADAIHNLTGRPLPWNPAVEEADADR